MTPPAPLPETERKPSALDEALDGLAEFCEVTRFGEESDLVRQRERIAAARLELSALRARSAELEKALRIILDGGLYADGEGYCRFENTDDEETRAAFAAARKALEHGGA